MSLVPLITVFGATGAQGGGLAHALLDAADRPFRVRAVTRHPGGPAAQTLAAKGAELCAADLDDAASVERAMAGAHGVFAVTGTRGHCRPADELRQAGHLAEAAARTGVRHVLWSTLEDTRRFVEPDEATVARHGGYWNLPAFDAKGQADAAFMARGLPLTRLLTSFRWDELLEPGLHLRRRADGRRLLAWPMGGAALPGIAAEDIGACAAALFRQGAGAIGRRIGIAAAHLDDAALAAALTRALGEPVEVVETAPAGLFRFMRDFNAECRAVRDVAATRALHPGLLDFDAFLARHAGRLRAAFAGPAPHRSGAAAAPTPPEEIA